MKKPAAEFRIFGLSGLRSAAHPVLCIASVCVAAALFQALPARGQSASQAGPPYMGPNSRSPNAFSRYDAQTRFPADNDTSYMESIRLAQLKVARAESMFKDTDRLLKLATELNAEVTGPKAEPLGGAQLRKVSRIAKFARNIEKNMKLVFFPRRRPPAFFPNPFPRRPPNRH